MRFRIAVLVSGVGAVLCASMARGQTVQDSTVDGLFRLVYQAMDGKHLPAGPRTLVHDDPLIRKIAGQERILRGAGERFGNLVGLPVASIAEVMICERSYSYDCSFRNGVASTVALALTFPQTDSAVAFVAIRYFPDQSNQTTTRRPGWPRWQALAVYEASLARRNGKWSVIEFSVRAES
jgi:hypothetical protein